MAGVGLCARNAAGNKAEEVPSLTGHVSRGGSSHNPVKRQLSTIISDTGECCQVSDQAVRLHDQVVAEGLLEKVPLRT